MPSPSLRNALHKAMQADVPPFKAREGPKGGREGPSNLQLAVQCSYFSQPSTVACSLTSAPPCKPAPTCPPALSVRPSLQVSRVHKANSGTPAGLLLKPAAGPKKADYVYYDNIQWAAGLVAPIKLQPAAGCRA